MKLMKNVNNNVWSDYELSVFMLCFVILKITCHVHFMSRGSRLLTYNVLKKGWSEKCGSVFNFSVFQSKCKIYICCIFMKKDYLLNNFGHI